MRRQNSWTDPTIIGEHRGSLWFHRPEINSISGNVVIRPFPSHASKFPPRRLTTWLASPGPGLIRTPPLSHPLTMGEAVDCYGVSLPVPLLEVDLSTDVRFAPEAAIQSRLTPFRLYWFLITNGRTSSLRHVTRETFGVHITRSPQISRHQT